MQPNRKFVQALLGSKRKWYAPNPKGDQSNQIVALFAFAPLLASERHLYLYLFQ